TEGLTASHSTLMTLRCQRNRKDFSRARAALGSSVPWAAPAFGLVLPENFLAEVAPPSRFSKGGLSQTVFVPGQSGKARPFSGECPTCCRHHPRSKHQRPWGLPQVQKECQHPSRLCQWSSPSEHLRG